MIDHLNLEFLSLMELKGNGVPEGPEPIWLCNHHYTISCKIDTINKERVQHSYRNGALEKE